MTTYNLAHMQKFNHIASNVGSFLFKLFYFFGNGFFVFSIGLTIYQFLSYQTWSDLIEEVTTLHPILAILAISIGLLPIVSLALFIFSKPFRQTYHLFKYLFGFEIPVVILFFTLSTYSFFNSIIWNSTFITIVTLLCLPILNYILSFNFNRFQKKLVLPLFTIKTWLLLLTLYFALLYAFFFIPLFSNQLKELIETIARFTSGVKRYYGDSWITFVGYYAVSLTVLTIVPYVLVRSAIVLWHNAYKQLDSLLTGDQKKYLTAAVVLIFIITGILSTNQPQQRYLPLFEEYNKATTFEQKQTVASKLQKNQKAALAEAEYFSNARERYAFDSQTSITDEVYQDFEIPTPIRLVIDRAFLVVARPYTYNYSFKTNYPNLATVATEIFDYNIYTGMENSASTSVQQTFEQVTLTDRTTAITLKEDGRIALVTITETFNNLAFNDRETRAEFVLPEGSVIVDLNLGMNLEFPGLIAPRGAAKKTYEAEVRQKRDPALLQEIGPNQYRLRVFPIPQNGQQRVQYSYITLITPSGFGLPRYTDTVGFSNSASLQEQTLIDSKIAQVKNGFALPGIDYCELQNSLIGSSRQSFLITSVPASVHVCSEKNKLSALSEPIGKKIAIVLDVSASSAKAKPTDELIEFFKNNTELLQQNNVTLYRHNTLMAEPIPLTASNFEEVLSSVVWFGNSYFDSILEQAPTNVDAIFYLATAERSHTTTPNLEKIRNGPPLYLIYPSITTAPNWNPQVADSVFSRAVTTSLTIDEAWLAFAVTESPHPGSVVISPYWQVDPVAVETTLGEMLNPSFSSQKLSNDFPELYRAYSKLHKDITSAAAGKNLQNPDADTLSVLDQLTTTAQQLHTVTPLTSLIALVNETQLDRLDQNSQQSDRYADTNSEFSADQWRRGGNQEIGLISPGIGWASDSVRISPLTQRSTGFSATLNSLPTTTTTGTKSPSIDIQQPNSQKESKQFNSIILLTAISIAIVITVVKIVHKKKTITKE